MILELDRTIFYVVNHWRTPALDLVMPWLSDFSVVLPVAMAILVWRIIKGDRRERTFWLLLIIGVVVTDFVCARLLKPLFGRPRPYLALEHVYVLKHGVYKFMTTCGLKQGMRMSLAFPSCHASNSAFFGAYLAMEFRWAIPLSIILVLLVGYSRIYLGAHYPLDILAGITVGLLMAIAFRWPLNLMSPSGRRARPQNH